MKKIIFITLLLLISNIGFSSQYESPMSLYHDNYFVIGDENDQTKFQVSAKYALFYPSNVGLYVGYSQVCWWKTYESSSPFYETNYMPEIFARFTSGDNIFDNVKIPFIDYIQVSPIFHKSNGRDGEDSRGYNKYYGQIQLSAGEVYNIGTNLKVFGYSNQSGKNEDIEDYEGYYEADIFFKIKSKTVQYFDKEELHFKFGGNPLDKGWYRIEGQVRIFNSHIQPKLFVQYFKGYGEFLIDYNIKEESLRFGLTF